MKALPTTIPGAAGMPFKIFSLIGPQKDFQFIDGLLCVSASATIVISLSFSPPASGCP
jgi:hypothetical protein